MQVDDLKRAADAGDAAACYNLGVWHLGEPGRPADPDAARRRFRQAAERGYAPAQSALGYMCLRGQGAAPDPREARRWFTRAAQGGFAEAAYRLAEMNATGVGGEEDAAQARRLFADAAGAGHEAAACQLAYCLDHGIGGPRDPAAGTRALLAVREDPRARFMLGWRCERGVGTSPDPAVALDCYRRAEAGGYPGAAAARARLERALDSQVTTGAERRGLEGPEITPRDAAPPDPPRVPEALSWTPRAFRVRDCLDPVERSHLMAAATPYLRPSQVLRRGSGAIERDPGRTSGEMSFVNPLRDVVVHQVERRLSELVMLPLSHGEPLVMLHYGPGDEYQTHVDYFDPAIPGRQKGLRFGGQRLITVLTYLNQPEAGGETVFPEVGLTVPPEPGTALVFFNTLPDGTIDRLSRHAGAPVRAGEKWLATRWFRERPVHEAAPEPKSPAGSYSASFRL